jgi:hypothetical protein
MEQNRREIKLKSEEQKQKVIKRKGVNTDLLTEL